MNCPAKTEPILPDGHNQSPNDLCSDLTTRSDLGKLANARLQRGHQLSDPDGTSDTQIIPQPPLDDVHEKDAERSGGGGVENNRSSEKHTEACQVAVEGDPESKRPVLARWVFKVARVMKTYTKFMGPGFMVAVVRLATPT